MPIGSQWARGAFWAAIVAGVSFLIFMPDTGGSTLKLGWKGAGVWLLALYVLLNARSNDGWKIAGVMALGALGDVLIERDLTQGALAFAVGHALAISLYLKHRRPSLEPSQKMLALALPPVAVAAAWAMTGDIGVAVYTLLLSVMAGLAWTSRFTRYRTGIGAMMFVASDLLIFARMGVLAESVWVSPAIWGLYFAGQALIVLGVVAGLQGADTPTPEKA